MINTRGVLARAYALRAHYARARCARAQEFYFARRAKSCANYFMQFSLLCAKSSRARAARARTLLRARARFFARNTPLETFPSTYHWIIDLLPSISSLSTLWIFVQVLQFHLAQSLQIWGLTSLRRVFFPKTTTDSERTRPRIKKDDALEVSEWSSSRFVW